MSRQTQQPTNPGRTPSNPLIAAAAAHSNILKRNQVRLPAPDDILELFILMCILPSGLPSSAFLVKLRFCSINKVAVHDPIQCRRRKLVGLWLSPGFSADKE
jgi:hypothetical protein